MRKLTEELLINNTKHIDKEKIQKYNWEHTSQETKEYFNLTWSEYKYLKNKYKLKINPAVSEQKRKITKLKKYGNPTYNNTAKNKQTRLERYGDENYNNSKKQVATCRAKWGDNYNNRQQMKATFQNPTDVQRREIESKRRKTKLTRYGSETYNNMKQNIETRQVCPSKPEEELYLRLISQYGKEDIERQYYDKERYPYHCDFYIKSEDLFIELNAHWTHGPAPFDKDNEDHVKLLNLWKHKIKDSKFYENAIYVWTDLDVRKLNTLRANKLNFKLIYDKVTIDS